jgi:hypothetical protein
MALPEFNEFGDLPEPLERFLAFWQTTREGRKRGLVEIMP